MVIVRIIGGLGNQMFQYAYAKSLQVRGYNITIDISKFKSYQLHGGYHLDAFNIDIETSTSFTNFLSKIRLIKSIKERTLLFSERLKNPPKAGYIKGYFQTEQYFLEIRELLLKQFILKKELSSSTIAYLQEITIQKNACSLHIRRGDYISNKKANEVHGTCNIAYYKQAIKLMRSKHKDVRFFIFSDDISWVKKNLKVKDATYINHKVIPHEDLHLMSLCKHNITANSSFSWWGAWLNQNKNKVVIAPKQWFVSKENQVACKDWIQL